MSEHSERLIRIETKLDDLINLRLEDRITTEKKCQTHADWTAALANRVGDIEKHNTYIAGAGSVISVISMGALAVMWEKLKTRVGVK